MLFLKAWDNYNKVDYYSTIDEMPIKKWFAVHKTGEYKHLVKGDKTPTEKDYIYLAEAWEFMHNEYMQRFGLSEEFMADLNQSVRLAELQANFIITKKPHYRTLIKIEKEKIKDSKVVQPKAKELDSILAVISKYQGHKVSSKETTVSEYYNYINNMTNNG